MISHQRLASLAGCRDIDSLRSAMRVFCADFGRLRKIDVCTMTEADKCRALCFLLAPAADVAGGPPVKDLGPASRA